MAAAVADFKPSMRSDAKIKRDSGPPTVDLVPTPDVAQRCPTNQSTVLSSSDSQPRPAGSVTREEKAKRKGVDLLVGNDVSRSGSGLRLRYKRSDPVLQGRNVESSSSHGQGRCGEGPVG